VYAGESAGGDERSAPPPERLRIVAVTSLVCRRIAKRRWQLVGLLTALAVAAPALAAVVEQGRLRIMVSAQLKPYKLPRAGTGPIAVFLAAHVGSTDGSTPPQLRSMDVKLNRHGRLDIAGLPACRLEQLQPSSSDQALQRCGPALVGSGHFWASIVLPEQGTYHTTGRLLAFNGRQAGRPVLFAHIYTTVPFLSSFVVTFRIRHLARGPYGTELSASLPQALGDWGFVDRIKMTMRRRYRYRGALHSYLNAGCPAPQGTRAAVFPFALATLDFSGDQQLRALVVRPCGVSG